MNYYLIDYENVKTDGIKDITGMKANDVMIIFYSEQCKNITLDVIESITRLKIQVSANKAIVGTKNALDFQLASHLGYLIGKNGTGAAYHIVSNDKGYDCLCEYWRGQNINIDRISLQGTDLTKEKETIPIPKSKKKQSKAGTSDLANLEEVKKYLSKNDEPEMVMKIFNQHKTKQGICNAMCKYFKDSKKASGIYKKLKPLFKAKNKG